MLILITVLCAASFAALCILNRNLTRKTDRIMATQAEELAELNSFAARLTALKDAIDALKAAIVNGGNTTPEIDAALANVDAALKADEDDAAPPQG